MLIRVEVNKTLRGRMNFKGQLKKKASSATKLQKKTCKFATRNKQAQKLLKNLAWAPPDAPETPITAQRPLVSFWNRLGTIVQRFWTHVGAILDLILERCWNSYWNIFDNPLPRYSCYNCVSDAQGRRVSALALTKFVCRADSRDYDRTDL